MKTITTRIIYRGRWKNIDPNKPPKCTRMLDSFLATNCAPKCFLKGQGGWYKITQNGTLLYVIRALYLLTLNEFLEIALNNKYTA